MNRIKKTEHVSSDDQKHAEKEVQRRTTTISRRSTRR